MRQLPPHLRHLARSSCSPRPRPPHTPAVNREICPYLAVRSRVVSTPPPENADPIESVRDTSGRRGWGGACRSQKSEQVCCHPRTQPWNESSTVGAQSLAPAP